MEQTDSVDSPTTRMGWLVRVVRDRDPEEVVRDGMVFMAFTHLVALIYFVYKFAKDALCG